MNVLKIKKFIVKDILMDKASSYHDGVLRLCKDDLCAKVLCGIDGFEIDIKLAKPGDSTRIVHIMDTVKPACKQSGRAFSGWPHKIDGTGSGTTNQLEGVAVMQTCEFPGIQEGMIDMSGIGSSYSYFSGTLNVVIEMKLTDPNMNKQDFEKRAKAIILQAAEYLASLTLHEKEDKTEEFKLSQDSDSLCKVGYVCYVQAQGPLRNVFVQGESYYEKAPAWMHPNDFIDGAVVSSNFVIACQKNPTFFFQQNPVIAELYAQDGIKLQFGGVIISTEGNGLEDKKINAEKVAEIAKEKGFSGVVISHEGGGHAIVDLMMCVEACEKIGISTVILTNETAGPKGDLPPLTSFSDMANAIVTNGNNDEVIHIGKMERALGGETLLGKHPSTDALETTLGIIYTATNQLGFNKMTTAIY